MDGQLTEERISWLYSEVKARSRRLEWDTSLPEALPTAVVSCTIQIETIQIVCTSDVLRS